MQLLVIGGTSFVGRHTVEAAVAASHEVTVFNRGRTNPDLFGGRIERRRGDRESGDYAALVADETWNAVIDTSAYVPRHVHQLAATLAGRGGHYVHVSSVSAYDPEQATLDESSPLRADLEDSTEEVTAATYGPLKAMCERAAEAAFGAVATAIVRPTYVCGPHDPTDRFTYWARRTAEGGSIAVPSATAPMQLVDARDLGAFLLHLAESVTPGAFDGVGPWAPTAELLASIAPAGVECRFVEVGPRAGDAEGWTLPMVPDTAEGAALSSRPGTAGRAAGLVTRPASETAEATRAWDAARGSPLLTAGPTRAQEATALGAAGG